MSTLPPWDPDEYDREVKAARRRAAQQAQTLARAPLTQVEARRLPNTPTRHRAAARRLRPRALPDGRWLVVTTAHGMDYRTQFDTKAEAEAFICEMEGDD